MWVKVDLVKNGYVLTLYEPTSPLTHFGDQPVSFEQARWIAEDTYDLSKRFEDIEEYLKPEKKAETAEEE